MVFVYKYWDAFCKALNEKNVHSIPASQTRGKTSFFVLKHDVENSVPRALKLAQIEAEYGHKGTYYVHAYLLDDPGNVEALREIQRLGHEVSYHYDVMDSNKGNIDAAIREFRENVEKFESLGFPVVTVCQHGNPIVERVGYTSNRDFFRNPKVQALFPDIADVMVNYKQNYGVEYLYYSDAGRQFKLIFDPINNDVVNSDEKNIPYPDLFALLEAIDGQPCVIVSTHPHRFTGNAVIYKIKDLVFKAIKTVAKVLMKIPFMKKIMSKYYYLAKKI